MALSAAGAQSVAVGGLWTDNKIATLVYAYIDGATSLETTTGGLSVTASDTSHITANAFAGAVAANLSAREQLLGRDRPLAGAQHDRQRRRGVPERGRRREDARRRRPRPGDRQRDDHRQLARRRGLRRGCRRRHRRRGQRRRLRVHERDPLEGARVDPQQHGRPRRGRDRERRAGRRGLDPRVERLRHHGDRARRRRLRLVRIARPAPQSRSASRWRATSSASARPRPHRRPTRCRRRGRPRDQRRRRSRSTAARARATSTSTSARRSPAPIDLSQQKYTDISKWTDLGTGGAFDYTWIDRPTRWLTGKKVKVTTRRQCRPRLPLHAGTDDRRHRRPLAASTTPTRPSGSTST